MPATKLNGPAAPTLGPQRRLAHLIDLYERNFQLLERLLPELELPFDHAVSRSDSDLPLHLIAVERSPYTVELRLTYEFREPEGLRLAPDFWIKVYRDARVAEAQRCSQRPPWLAQEGGAPEVGAYLHDQWSRNLMLARWLEYLLHHGHGFAHIARPRHAAAALAAA
ncbi:MAG: DUF1249 domain-containing protein [Stagnimonas sp.]|nr:DUF1249 domain-containing protein [Stagnimonas sp.]